LKLRAAEYDVSSFQLHVGSRSVTPGFKERFCLKPR